ncbi:type VI secretion system baseplate subunit TssE [Tropicimonas sp. S265A]|uniref:type VI secretion system baseplate subunit TssE n=1 Tax=Tropicimonas sp. S265A TaxID=3415134 RepID=UPI003C7C122C
MADRTIADRLQPSLLDRLTDDEPRNLKEGREARVIDVRRLRDIISRDLSWLLNTSNQESSLDAKVYPNVLNSTLNYGIREVAGDFSTTRRAQEIQKSIRQAVERFEPRIASDSIRVDLRSDTEVSNTIIHFDIRAIMWAQPMPQELFMRTQVNLVTGELSLDRSG